MILKVSILSRLPKPSLAHHCYRVGHKWAGFYVKLNKFACLFHVFNVIQPNLNNNSKYQPLLKAFSHLMNICIRHQTKQDKNMEYLNTFFYIAQLLNKYDDFNLSYKTLYKPSKYLRALV